MKTEGLRAILEKEEIVATRLARDFIESPQIADDLYKHYVRTYIPLQPGSDEASGVEGFAKKFIKQVKEARAPRGYITADFGYGKTSAGLFVWQQAQNARLIAVPPFKLNRLEDLLEATAGWMAFIFERNVPTLVERVHEIYHFYTNRNLQHIAQRYGMSIEQVQNMYEDKTLQLDVTPKDIVSFFVKMTDLALEGGFEGLVLIPDELQQYLEPQIKSGRVDPLVPLFDIVTDLMNHQGNLPFGFLMIITSKELGVINDQRGDLIDRLRGNTLDLRTIYDREFTARLWSRFADIFDFNEIAFHVVDPFALESLGQIASRQDLSNGPRTVINTFRRIAERALNSGDELTPYTPIDLVDDFLKNNIAFDARKALQEATNRALSANSIRGHHEFERAIKLLAAFPTDGARRQIQEHYHLLKTCTELKLLASPEIVLEVGERNEPALVLRGLDQTRESTDELTLVLSEFARNYQPQAAHQIEQAVNAFSQLLSTLVFKSENWSSDFKQARRHSQKSELSFNGAFPDMVRKFPERDVYIRILGDDEFVAEQKYKLEGDCNLIFVLHRYFEVDYTERQAIVGDMKVDKDHYTAYFHLNLMLPCFDTITRLLQDQLRKIVDIESINVLMILNLHEFLQKAAERDGVSKPLKDMIQRSLSVRLLEAALEVMLNVALGAHSEVAGARLVEKAVVELVRARYGQNYHTLITFKQWRDKLRDYITALKQLPSFAQRQGYALVEGNKEEIAKYFGSTAASFDAFQNRFSTLIEIDGGAFPTRDEIKQGRKGGIRFTYHPLENKIYTALQEIAIAEDRQDTPALSVEGVYTDAARLGYRQDEIKYILDIMQARDLIEVIDEEWIVEKPRPDISLEKIYEQISDLKEAAERLVAANEQADTRQMLARAEQYAERFNSLDEHKNEVELVILAEQVEADLALLETVVEREVKLLQEDIGRLGLEELRPETINTLHTRLDRQSISAIEKIRTQYVEELSAWQEAFGTYQHNLTELRDNANISSIYSLLSMRNQIKQTKQAHLDLNDQKRLLSRATENLKIWREVGSLLESLYDTLSPLGQAVEQELKILKGIDNTLQNALQQNPEDTFAQASHYREELSNLERRSQQLANNAERIFNDVQNQYRQLFVQRAKLSRDKLWQPIFYSEGNAEQVHRNLLAVIKKQVADLLESLYTQIEVCGNELLSAKTLGNNRPNDIEKQLNKAEEQLRIADFDYTKLSDSAVKETIEDIEKFTDWLAYFEQVRQSLYTIQAFAQSLREEPRQLLLSPKAQSLMDIVSKLGTSINLIRIRQELSTISDEEFWHAVRELWEQQQIDISLKKLD